MSKRMQRFLCFVALVLVLSPVAAREAQALSPHLRDGWLLGVAYGYGRGKVTLFPDTEGSGLDTEQWQRGVVPQMRLGYTVIANRLTISVDNKQWIHEQGILADDKSRINVQNWSLALTYYPGNPYNAWGGLYLEAGGGLANARLTLLEPIEDDPYGETHEEIFKQDEGGSAFFFSAGYEFRLVSSLAAGLAVSVVYQSIDGDIFDDAVSVPATLTLNWYW